MAQLEAMNEPVIELLKAMLQFNPYLRPTASELLQHSFFDDVRDPTFEAKSRCRLELNVDSEANYDAATDGFKMKNEELRDEIYKFVAKFQY